MWKLIFVALVVVACAKTDDAAVDTTAAVTPAAPSLSPVQTMYAGTWNGRSYRANAAASDTGSKWVMTFTPADAGLTGTLRFDGQTTDILIRVDEATDAGMRTTFGPYVSPTAGNAEVTTTTDGRMQGDSLFGSFVATPTTGDRISGRFAARRQ
ncbi:MAG: hypothetical protein NUW01_01990 [Gemmatimonadaceae bacterium]|nr:hypothetical protein [Gemmatimonadaceae bacterium]